MGNPAKGSEIMICFRQVSKTYRKGSQEIAALRSVSLEVGKGELLLAKGPSGCGKTTLLLAAGGLLHPDSGSITLLDKDLYTMSPDGRAAFRAAHIGFVFQQYHLIPYLTVLENVLVSSLAAPSPFSARDALDLLERVGLAERAMHVPAELSAGEKQRTALARALLCRPTLLLADEITGNLDSENARMVLEQLKEFSRQGGTVLLVTHDEKADRLADRILTMDHGAIGPPPR
jgi:putative ABC transport system ATP-binding protein